MTYDFRDKSVEGAIVDFDSDTNDRIKFDYIPGEITESIQANWEEVTIIGRSNPILTWGSTGARQVSLQLTFFADGNDGGVRKEVFQKIRFLQSFQFPEYASNNVFAPHRVHLILGTFINIVGIMEASEVTWKAPYELDTKLPLMAEIPLTIKETDLDPRGFKAFRDDAGFSPISQKMEEIRPSARRGQVVTR